MEFEKAKQFILNKLKNELPANLFYHSLDHNLDVFNSAMMLAEMEGINQDEKNLLALAALLHDSGFIYQYNDHEEKSCEVAKAILINYGYSENEIQLICGMIMATKLPQLPKTKLEEIMCDADLDYLGREDFFETGKKLFHEFIYTGTVKNENEWNELQIRFLESHHYFTQSAIMLRKERKDLYLNAIKKNLTK